MEIAWCHTVGLDAVQQACPLATIQMLGAPQRQPEQQAVAQAIEKLFGRTVQPPSVATIQTVPVWMDRIAIRVARSNPWVENALGSARTYGADVCERFANMEYALEP